MNRSILTMAATGILGVVAMTLMMAHLLKVHPKGQVQEPAVKGFQELFAPNLRVKPRVRIRSSVLHEGGVAVDASVKPKITEDVQELLRSMGSYLWSQTFKDGKPIQVTITWTDPATGRIHHDGAPSPGRGKVITLKGRSTRKAKTDAKRGAKPKR